MEKYLANFENGSETEETLISLAEKIESLEDIEELRQAVGRFLEILENDTHTELSQEITKVYGEMSKENLLARVEGLRNIARCLINGEPIEVGAGDSHYANSVTADPEGLRIAMAEAEAPGPVRLLVGLDMKAMIGFSNDHVSVDEIDDNEFDLRDTTLRKAYCRHIHGQIMPEDIRYVVLRIPRRVFPEELMLEEEKNSGSKFIFRGGRTSGSLVEAKEYEEAA
jgi:hypothetical protein